jgi:hypothetical protein
MAEKTEPTSRWLLFVHQLPARPAYQRVKLHRRLQSIGAVAVKNTVHALPASDEALEDLLWTAKEIEAAGGEAFVCEARMVQGVNDAQLRALFDAARDVEYRAVAAEATTHHRRFAGKRSSSKRSASDDASSQARTVVERLRKRLRDIGTRDFFGANGREAAEVAVTELEARAMRSEKHSSSPPEKTPGRALKDLRGKTWATRRGVHVDRIACAWFIRKFIDPKARFKFVDPAGYEAHRNELRFDMADAEFTHRGDRCTFEVLLEESGLRDPALRAIAEVVHDLDLKDGKFARAETEGVRQLLSGITLASEDDSERLERGGALFDDLYRSQQRRPARGKRT